MTGKFNIYLPEKNLKFLLKENQYVNSLKNW